MMSANADRSPTPRSADPVGLVSSLADRLDTALLAMAAGRRRVLLELVRDEPGAVGLMAEQLAMSENDVSHDLSQLHAIEFEHQHDRFAHRYDPWLLAAAGLQPDSAVLDIGCGAGVSSRAAALVASSGTVLGIDASGPLVKRAQERSRAEGVTNTTFEHGDVHVFPFQPTSFDVAISRLGAMYFHEPVAAFTNVARSLRAGGRLALLAWQGAATNPWVVAISAAIGPNETPAVPPLGEPGIFGLADPERTRQTLTEAGLVDVGFEDVQEPVEFGSTLDDAFALASTLGSTRKLLARLGASDRRRALQDLREMLASHQTDEGVVLPSSAWIITARSSHDAAPDPV